jgi:hypothetical protein
VQFTDAVCQDSSNPTLQEALDDAGATAVDDTIHIGPVLISEDPNGPNGPGLAYTSTAGAGNDVTLIGQGVDTTTITRADTREFATFTTSTNSHVTFQDLSFFIAGNTGLDSSAFNALRVLNGGATMTGVLVTAQDSVFNHAFNSGVRLVLASGPLTMTNSTIDGAGNQNAECLQSTAANTPAITGTEFIDCDFGVRAVASSYPLIDRSTFTGGGTDARVEDGASIDINRSRFFGDASSLRTLDFFAHGQFRIDNSLIVHEADTTAINVAPDTDGDISSGVVNQSTLVNTFASPSGGVGIFVNKGSALRTAEVAVHDTVVFGFFNSMFRFGTLTSDHSFYDFDTGDHTPGTGDIDSVGDTVDPGFANPLGEDYALAPDSILRDVDPLTTARAGEFLTTDLAGEIRIDNSARDIGAYEFPFVPEPTFAAVSPASPANDNTPVIIGAAEAGSTVRLYTNAACTIPAGVPTPAADFLNPGIEVTVPDNSTTAFHAKATDAGAHVSECSAASITYVEDSTPPAVIKPPAPGPTGQRAAALKKCKKKKKSKPARASCRKKAQKLPL